MRTRALFATAAASAARHISRPHPPHAAPGLLELIDPCGNSSIEGVIGVIKPPNLLATPGKQTTDSVVARLRNQLGVDFVEAPHRLDLQTSGVMALCLDKASVSAIGKQFEQGLVQKTYVAWIHGTLPQAEGEIDLPIYSDFSQRPLQIICKERGKASITRYQVLDEKGGQSLVQLNPLTGRTHQLRVHLAALGTPIIGDTLYAHDEAYMLSSDRMLLHSTELTFQHPLTMEELVLAAPCPF
jgi:tRNA pseudouridine32 synthase/23S rRNA pseudouridine746 synthase